MNELALAADESRISLRARLLLRLLRKLVKPQVSKPITLAGARAFIARFDRWIGGRGADYRRTAVSSFSLAADWIAVHPQRRSRVILYLHGGGFMFHMPAAHSRLAAQLCRMLDAEALLPNYRCAPEHPLPAAHEDCLTAYLWLLAEGVAPENIIVIGDSAGGLLTLATLQRIRDSGLPPPLCGVMFSPGTCVDSIRALGPDSVSEDPMLGAGILELLQREVVAHVAPDDPAVSPCAGSLHALPPLLFQVGSTETLLHQSTKAHALATSAGTIAELQVWPQMPHVWQAVHWLPEARQALHGVAEFVHRQAQARAQTALAMATELTTALTPEAPPAPPQSPAQAS